MFEIIDLKFKNILDIPQVRMAEDIVCLIGPSGCGKSTLLRMLNRMEAPDNGAIHYNNTDISVINAIELRREITMLPQAPVIYEGTVRDNLLAGLKFQHRSLPDDQALMDVLDLMYLRLKLDADAAKLSGGEKQRICLGRVILLDSPVYLFDEPSAALDPTNEKRIMDNIIKWIKDKNKQMIMVTHAVELAELYAQQLISMEEGRIV